MATARFADDSVMDAALDKVATSTILRVCSGASNPVDRAAAITATLASVVVDGTDFTKANGDVSGRKTTVATQSNISITTSGDATCVVLDNGVIILYIVPSTTQPLTAGGTVTTPAFDVEIGDPVAP